MAKTAKKLRFYSQEEVKQLQSYIDGNKIDKEHIKEFCKTYKREMNSVYAVIYTRRKAAGNATPRKDKFKTEAKFKSSKKVGINMAKGEFKIPISNWNVSQDNGQFYFVVKF